MTNNLSDGMIEYKYDPELFSKLSGPMPEIRYNVKLPEIPDFEISNPNEEVENLLNQQNKKLDKQTEELQFIRYENMKLNAQIEILNKTNDKQLSEIKNQQDHIIQLKCANKRLQSIIDGAKWGNAKAFILGIIGTVTAEFIIRFIMNLIKNQ